MSTVDVDTLNILTKCIIMIVVLKTFKCLKNILCVSVIQLNNADISKRLTCYPYLDTVPVTQNIIVRSPKRTLTHLWINTENI